jgi:hypothetical protein
MRARFVMFALALDGTALAHGGEGEPAGEPTEVERAAYEAALPAFQAWCTSCHAGDDGREHPVARDHLDMTGYPFGGEHGGSMAAAMIREVVGGNGHAATMPADDPGAVRGHDLALVLAWADAAEAAHADDEPDEDEHREHGGHEGQVAWSVPREGLIPGRPAMAGATHLMINGFAHVENVGLDGYAIRNAGETVDGGAAHPLLTGDWAMGYWRQAHGWVEAEAMLDLEPLTIGPEGWPELGQSGEGLVDAQHPHQLVHQAMVAFHPLSGTEAGDTSPAWDPRVDLSLFAGQGSATVGPPIYMHRGSSPGPTVPRKHHKGENPHETFPVVGASLKIRRLWLEGSAFNGRELTPDDSRLYPHPGPPTSVAGRVRYDVAGLAEVQVSGARLRDERATQGSASVMAWHELGDWRLDGLADYAIDAPDGEPTAQAVLGELAVRDPAARDVGWARLEWNQREETAAFGGGVTPWAFGSLGAERVFAVNAPSGLQLGVFGEATYGRIPGALEPIYGGRDVVSVDIGVHLLGMWMLDERLHRMEAHAM